MNAALTVNCAEAAAFILNLAIDRLADNRKKAGNDRKCTFCKVAIAVQEGNFLQCNQCHRLCHSAYACSKIFDIGEQTEFYCSENRRTKRQQTRKENTKRLKKK